MALPKACFSAGHGMSSRVVGSFDPGACGCGYREADVVLGMVQRLSYDWAALAGKVYLRDVGNYATGDAEAYNAGCKVYLEVHLNAFPDAAAHGTEVWVYSKPTSKELALAQRIVNAIAALGFTNRGVKKSANLAALTPYEGMASALVEICFITNRGDMNRYQGDPTKVELAILNAMLTYFGARPVTTPPRTWSPPRTWMWRIFRR